MISYLKDLNALVEDLMELKPTLFAGVPRVFERVHDGMETNLLSSKYFLNSSILANLLIHSFSSIFQVLKKHYKNSIQ